MKRLLVLALVGIMFVLSGCGAQTTSKMEKSLIGKWKITETQPIKSQEKGSMGNALTGMAAGMMFSKGTSIQFLNNSTMSIMGSSGKYKLIDSTHLEMSFNDNGTENILMTVEVQDKNMALTVDDVMKVSLTKTE